MTVFFPPYYYPCSVMGVLGRCFSSLGAAFLTNLKVVIYETIYWEMAKISKKKDVKRWGIKRFCPLWITIVSLKFWWEEQSIAAKDHGHDQMARWSNKYSFSNLANDIYQLWRRNIYITNCNFKKKFNYSSLLQCLSQSR